jgi:hypothetical protein
VLGAVAGPDACGALLAHPEVARVAAATTLTTMRFMFGFISDLRLNFLWPFRL